MKRTPRPMPRSGWEESPKSGIAYLTNYILAPGPEKMLTRWAIRVTWLSRTGWMQAGIPSSIAETVSQHTFLSMAVAVDLMERFVRDVDDAKVLTMLLVHDIPEALMGDLPKWTSHRIERTSIEREAIDEMSLPEGTKELLMEFLEGKSREALLAKLSDALATLLAARGYARMGHRVERIEESSLKRIEELCEELKIESVEVLEGFMGMV